METVHVKATNRADFLQEAGTGAFEGIYAVYRNLPSVSITGRIDAELLEALPRSLKFICHVGKAPSLLPSACPPTHSPLHPSNPHTGQ